MPARIIGRHAIAGHSDQIAPGHAGKFSSDRQRLAGRLSQLPVLDLGENQDSRHQSAFASSRMYLRISFAATAGSPPSIFRPPLFSAGNSSETIMTRWL